MFKRKKVNELPQRRPVRSSSGGTERSPAFSYHTSRSPDDANVGRLSGSANERLTPPQRTLQRLVRHAGLAAILVTAMLVVIGQSSLSTVPKIVPLSTSTSQVFLRSQTAYQRAASELLARSLADRDKLTINTAAISRDLEHDFPELSDVSVTLPILGHQPIIYIQPSEPSMVLATQNSGSFVLAANGKALIPATSHTTRLATPRVPVVSDQSGLQLVAGQTALPSTTVNFVHVVATQLAAQHIAVSSMTLPKAAGELDVYIAGKPFFVKFNTEDAAILQQIGTFSAVLQHLQAQNTLPHTYIDVRVDGRAYYK